MTRMATSSRLRTATRESPDGDETGDAGGRGGSPAKIVIPIVVAVIVAGLGIVAVVLYCRRGSRFTYFSAFGGFGKGRMSSGGSEMAHITIFDGMPGGRLRETDSSEDLPWSTKHLLSYTEANC
jgi:hypothetical protein